MKHLNIFQILEQAPKQILTFKLISNKFNT